MSEFNLLKFCKDLYEVPRSLTGSGVRDTLNYISEIIPIKTKKIKSGTKVFDWIIPPEWNVKSAYIIELETGKKVVDFNNHRLHLVGYSEPIECKLDYNQLVPKLHYLKELPDAIPYITSYYKKNWGFCLSYNQFKKLNKSSNYKIFIDSSFNPDGYMNYGELYIPGKVKSEIFFSSYICHPQMVNNELSGPSVLTGIAKSILETENYYSYRFVLIPETIGSIAYLSKNLKNLKKNVVGGFVITCVGDERDWGLIPSRYGDNLSDKIAEHVLKYNVGKFTKHTWLDRGSDERQYCAPGIDLPISSITRSLYRKYPEYHTSLDDFSVVTKKGLEQSFNIYKKCIQVFESGKDIRPKVNILGEPRLGPRGLYPQRKANLDVSEEVRNILNFISYSDGENTILEISELCNISFFKSINIWEKLRKHGLVS